MAKTRDYRKEYDTYHGQPDQIRNRASRNAARAKVEKAAGHKLPTNKEVDHADGNPRNNGKGNLKVMTRTANRRKGG